MRQRLPIALAGLLAASPPCLSPIGATAAPRTQIVKSGEAAKIAYYDSLCDEDNYVECLTAEIGCSGPGDFTASLFNLDNREAASVFARGNGKGSVAAAQGNWTLQVSRLALSEHSYNWDVTAMSFEKGAEIWRSIWSANDVQLQAGTRKTLLRRSDVDETAFRDVVATCAAQAR